MTVSMDGLRKHIAASFNHLVKLRLKCDRDGLDPDELEALTGLRQNLATLMLIYSEDPQDLMSELDPDQLLIDLPGQD